MKKLGRERNLELQLVVSTAGNVVTIDVGCGIVGKVGQRQDGRHQIQDNPDEKARVDVMKVADKGKLHHDPSGHQRENELENEGGDGNENPRCLV
mmetsp:Transcript_51361/g.76211  ORF Transcript_51361/g.76211 Transcript_51361/m.76211 type:complete len:95 (+) Transcript_51361:1777-2061(+)